MNKKHEAVPNGARRSLFQMAGAGLLVSAAGGAAAQAVVDTPRVDTPGVDTPGAVAASSGPQAAAMPVDKKLAIISPAHLQEQARKVMTPGAYAFITGATGDEWTLQENRRAFNDFPIRTHRLQGMAAKDVDLSIELLGHKLAYPIMVAPMGVHLFAHPQGEVATVAGAAAAGALYQSSGASYQPLEAIAKAGTGPKWFQLYFNADVGVTRSLLERAKAAGYTAIIITADALGPGASDAFKLLGMPFPPGLTFGNHDPLQGGTGNFRHQKVALTPDDIGFVKSVSGLPVIVKGLMRGVDADAAIRAGASAIQVSNHGGRQIDGVPGAISVLPEVVKAVKGRVPVIFDSGIRRGIDVLRALSLGAQAVAVGRPVLYGLALGGPSGVQSVMEQLRDELQLAMLLAGAGSVRQLDGSFVKA
ncbi:alpha-hydroxy-acid oxidizing protein [Acidovorax sp. Be4]|uniref:Alpha-hydroxy-acid oxidizing protein n=1 Tax=Acidovorax bellezanensis TaxID=2976702 RepID=A0ABT2PJR8_9BURK|nr:alpha-hydroxy-acid oxidizing protein [Acidovorax sp. Be4]MCT9810730.1 alpha-hydroxy-acid oxidizing protein [Acidovorax sp. Be4]